MSKIIRYAWIAVQAVSLMAVAAALALLVLVFGIPGMIDSERQREARNYELESRVESVPHANGECETYELKLDEARLEAKSLRQQIMATKQIVSDGPTGMDFNKAVTKLAESAGVHVYKFSPQPPVAHDLITEETFFVNVTGRYDAILKFSQLLEKQDRLTSVPRILLANSIGNAAPGEFDVSFAVSLFFNPPVAGGPSAEDAAQ